MWKVYLSRWVNYYLFAGRSDEMLSSRAYRECWVCACVIDCLFFWQKSHCLQSYTWEEGRRNDVDKQQEQLPFDERFRQAEQLALDLDEAQKPRTQSPRAENVCIGNCNICRLCGNSNNRD